MSKDHTPISGHFNYPICKLCGGKCCKKTPGIYSPADFGREITSDFVFELLDTGRITVDYWSGDDREGNIYFLRPSTVGEGFEALYPMGVCVNLNKETGCTLSEKDRPLQCRMLVPGFSISGDNFYCKPAPGSGTEKEDMARLWLPHKASIYRALLKKKREKTTNHEI